MATDGGLINVVTDADPQAGDESVVARPGGGDGAAILLGQGTSDESQHGGGHVAGVFHDGVGLSEFPADQAMVGFEHGHGFRGGVFFQVGEHAGNAFRVHGPIGPEAQFGELLSERGNLFAFGGHGGKSITRWKAI